MRDRLLSTFEAYDKFVDGYGAKGFGSFGGSCTIDVRGMNIGIVGFNSALMCGRNKHKDGWINDQGFLTVGEIQARGHFDAIEGADLRIALIHHPFDWLAEFDRRQIEKLIKGKSHFILRGHEHVAQVEITKGTNSGFVYIPAGASYDRRKPTDAIYTNAYNFVVFDTETGKGNVYLRCLNRLGDLWIADHETYKNGLLPFKFPSPKHRPNPPRTSSRNNKATEAAAKEQALTEVRRQYLKYVCDRWQKLEIKGIQQMGKTAPVDLDEVYVSLTTEREVFVHRLTDDRLAPPNALDPSLETSSSSSSFNEYSNDLSDIRELGEFHRARRVETKREKIDLPGVLRDHKHAVVLGDPGAGKTTLARFVARHFALACLNEQSDVIIARANDVSDDYGQARLPILLRVADYAEALKTNGNVSLCDFLHKAREAADISEVDTTALFINALRDGMAIVILDGLDEVTHTADRAAIGRHIDDFTHGIGANCRILVTSRIAGYPAARLTAGFAEFTIRDMEMEQIERFVTRRVKAYERTQTPGLSEAAIETNSRPEIAAIMDAVRNNEGVKRLAVNPFY